MDQREISLGELINVEVQLKSSGWEKARVKWLFSSGAELRGGRITSSNKNEDGLWAQLPKYKSIGGQYNLIIKLRPEDQDYLEAEALKKYKLADSEVAEIDLDDIAL